MEKKLVCMMLLLQHITTFQLKNKFMLDFQGSGQKQLERNLNNKECKTEFQLFDQKYLKGVLKPYYTTTNSNVTMNECMQMCCNQPPSTCKSFSYFVDLKVCYLMNVTQFDEFVFLQTAISFKHFHRKSHNNR